MLAYAGAIEFIAGQNEQLDEEAIKQATIAEAKPRMARVKSAVMRSKPRLEEFISAEDLLGVNGKGYNLPLSQFVCHHAITPDLKFEVASYLFVLHNETSQLYQER
jgi:hypothetical protein